MESNQNLPKSRITFSCETCDFNTSNKKDYNKHLATRKHINRQLSNQFEPESPQKTPIYACNICNKQLTSKSGLWSHSKKCTKNNHLHNDLVIELIKQNHEFKELIIEQNKKIIELASEPKTITTNNTNNTQFNLQLFLNEKCKDAITANEFVENLQISFDDLENLGNKGYVEGITNIILKGLKMLDVTKRPFHCTDVKRETMYIKDINEWTKDSEDKTKLKSVIENVATKNKYKAKEWRETHPGIHVLDSHDNNMHMKLFGELMAIETDKEEKLKERIIKILAKEVHVDK